MVKQQFIDCTPPPRRAYVRWYLLCALYAWYSEHNQQTDNIPFSKIKEDVESKTICPTIRTVSRELRWLEENEYLAISRKKKRWIEQLPDGTKKHHREHCLVSLTVQGLELSRIAYHTDPTDLHQSHAKRNYNANRRRWYYMLESIKRDISESERIYGHNMLEGVGRKRRRSD